MKPVISFQGCSTNKSVSTWCPHFSRPHIPYYPHIANYTTMTPNRLFHKFSLPIQFCICSSFLLSVKFTASCYFLSEPGSCHLVQGVPHSDTVSLSLASYKDMLQSHLLGCLIHNPHVVWGWVGVFLKILHWNCHSIFHFVFIVKVMCIPVFLAVIFFAFISPFNLPILLSLPIKLCYFSYICFNLHPYRWSSIKHAIILLVLDPELVGFTCPSIYTYIARHRLCQQSTGSNKLPFPKFSSGE